ncbi:MAG: aldehyde dehydrogenase family protein, partial [Pseudomonadota bacterium]|nr:aldehyde dehydrogenase family protein [Pseudomonadota bacterium]
VIPGGQFRVMYEPRGVCLLFGPWNFPFQLVLEPLVPIVAAGNCAMVKPNEMAPQTSKVTAKVIREAFGEADVAIFEGGIDLANRLLELPIDHVFFTGSPKVGRTVMAAAAKHLASVTLELGGKCPAIVDGTYDLAASAAQIGTWRCYNTGQLCLSPDQVWIRRDLRDTFLDHLGQALRDAFYVNGTVNKDVLGKIVDERNFDRVKGYIDDAVRRGAKVVFGGETERADRTIHPTVLVDVPHDAAVMEDEIFGPVLPVLTYTHPDEITDFLQRRGKPLAMYIFSENDKLIDQILANSSSGGVTINGIALHWFEMDMPFGGVNDSGIGRYHGIHGFRELSHERAIFRQTTQDK